MIKKFYINTNEYNNAQNFFVELINNSDNSISLLYPIFTEIIDKDTVTLTGIYKFQLDLALGNYYLTVKHQTIDKTGKLHFVIKENKYLELETTITNLDDDSISFA